MEELSEYASFRSYPCYARRIRPGRLQIILATPRIPVTLNTSATTSFSTLDPCSDSATSETTNGGGYSYPTTTTTTASSNDHHDHSSAVTTEPISNISPNPMVVSGGLILSTNGREGVFLIRRMREREYLMMGSCLLSNRLDNQKQPTKRSRGSKCICIEYLLPKQPKQKLSNNRGQSHKNKRKDPTENRETKSSVDRGATGKRSQKTEQRSKAAGISSDQPLSKMSRLQPRESEDEKLRSARSQSPTANQILLKTTKGDSLLSLKILSFRSFQINQNTA